MLFELSIRIYILTAYPLSDASQNHTYITFADVTGINRGILRAWKSQKQKFDLPVTNTKSFFRLEQIDN